jgi:hypothetical protein
MTPRFEFVIKYLDNNILSLVTTPQDATQYPSTFSLLMFGSKVGKSLISPGNFSSYTRLFSNFICILLISFISDLSSNFDHKFILQ